MPSGTDRSLSRAFHDVKVGGDGAVRVRVCAAIGGEKRRAGEERLRRAAGTEARHDFGGWRPFAHVMAGAARQTSEDVQTSTGPFHFVIHDRATSLALKVGGGIDVRISPRVDLRVI